MAYDDKVSLNLSRVSPNFFGGLASHYLCDGIKTELLQSGNSLVKYIREGIFPLNEGSSVGYIRQQKCSRIHKDR